MASPIIRPNDENVTIKGRSGTWYALYAYRTIDGTMYYVMESELYGDMAEWLTVDENGNIIEDEEILWNIQEGKYEEVD